MTRKKTEYYMVLRKHTKRRIWEDENGVWFTVWRGKREPCDRKRYRFLIKHQDSLKLDNKEES